MSKAVHGLPIISVNDTVDSFWMDGVELVWANGVWNKLGGWNPDEPGGPLRNTHKTYDADGNFIEEIMDVPWAGRHNFLAGRIFINGIETITISGGDDVTGGGGHLDLWHYTISAGWVEVVTTGTDYRRDHYTRIIRDQYGYAIGGNNTATGLPANNIIRINLETGFRELWATLPAGMHGVNNAASGIIGDRFVFAGGGYYSVDHVESISTKCFTSDDDGLTWTDEGSFPLLNSCLWAASTTSGQRLIIRTGSNIDNDVNADNRLLFTEYPIEFKEYPVKLPGTHAGGAATRPDTGDVVFVQGLAQNTFFKMPLLANQFKANV